MLFSIKFIFFFLSLCHLITPAFDQVWHYLFEIFISVLYYYSH